MADESKPTGHFVPPAQRLMCLDALRGFDMFWIIGAEGLVEGLRKISDTGPIKLLADQLEHKEWQGLHFEDLIFPLFVFMAGISIVFSLTRAIESSGRGGALKRVFRRATLLYFVGIFYYGGFGTPFERIRLLGVLQRIALCYLFASVLYCYLKPRALVGACAGILIGYWAVLALVPIRDISLEKGNLQKLQQATGITNAMQLYQNTTNRVTGKFDEGRNVANHFDFNYLPGRKWDGAYDPEGCLSTLPAIATCLLGVFAGMLLRNESVPGAKKVMYLVGAGLAGIIVGWVWDFEFPVIKKLWTSSYVLVAGGYSALLLAAFYQIVEVWKFQKWAVPFVWIGTNSITIYLAYNLIDFDSVAARFVGGDLNSYFGIYGRLVIALASLGLVFWFVRSLYRRKIFLRL